MTETASVNKLMGLFTMGLFKVIPDFLKMNRGVDLLQFSRECMFVGPVFYCEMVQF